MSLITRFILAVIVAIALTPVQPAAGADRAELFDDRVVLEREKRFLLLEQDLFAASGSVASEDIKELERQREAVTPLEPSKREADLTDLLDWYNRYATLVSGASQLVEGEFAGLSAISAGNEQQIGYLLETAGKENALSRELADKVKGYQAERKRLADIIERRTELQSLLNDMQLSLTLLDRRETDQVHPLTEKEKMDQRRLKERIWAAQAEFLALPDISYDILNHYSVMIEIGHWQVEWLNLEVREYDALHTVETLIPGKDRSTLGALIDAYQRLIASYQREIADLRTMVDDLDRRRSSVPTAGTLREMERSKDLIDLYVRLRERFDRRIGDLKIRIGSCEAEIAELRSLRSEP